MPNPQAFGSSAREGAATRGCLGEWQKAGGTTVWRFDSFPARHLESVMCIMVLYPGP